ncbi:hypothetical protein Tco_0037959 [Tanacetum coccineum]
MGGKPGGLIWFLPSVCDAGQYDRVGNTAGNTTLFNRFYGSRELELEMSACREVGSNHIFQFSNIGSDTTELVKAREAMMWTCLEKLFDSTQASLNELIKSLFEIGTTNCIRIVVGPGAIGHRFDYQTSYFGEVQKIRREIVVVVLMCRKRRA